uniref:F-box domain-containing protein n=1 Tax=Steinernema glaseri TaxID=37863 RepID=A0A1I7Y7Q1_9BILA
MSVFYEIPEEVVEKIICYVPKTDLPSLFEIPFFSRLAKQHYEARFDLQITVNASMSPRLFDFGLWNDGELESSIAPEQFRTFRWDLLTLKKIKFSDFLHSLNCCMLDDDSFFQICRRFTKVSTFALVAEQEIPNVFHNLFPSFIKLMRKQDLPNDLFVDYLYSQLHGSVLQKLELVEGLKLDGYKDVITKLFEKEHLTELILPEYDPSLNSELAEIWLKNSVCSKRVTVPLSGMNMFEELKNKPSARIISYPRPCCMLFSIFEPPFELKFDTRL